jgi:hypothetical protein
VQKRVVVQHRPEGRQILLGDMLKTITANGTETRQLAEEKSPCAERPFCVDRGVKQRGACCHLP